MPYQKLNQDTLAFTFPIPNFDDAVEDIDTEAKYFIYIDMDSGYWKVVAEEEAQKRLIFFNPKRKFWLKVMPMRDLNAAPTFVAILMKLKWNGTS